MLQPEDKSLSMPIANPSCESNLKSWHFSFKWKSSQNRWIEQIIIRTSKVRWKNTQDQENDARGHRVYTDRYEEYKQYQRWCNNKIFILVLYSLGVLSAGFYLLLTTWWPGQGFIVPVSWVQGGVCLHITGHITSRNDFQRFFRRVGNLRRCLMSVMCPW